MTFIEAYHVGFVVADLEATMSEFADRLGVRWASVQHRDGPVRTPEGMVPAAFRFTYSTPLSGGALIELIEGPAGTPWDPGEGVAAAFHHLGFWADDLPGVSRDLEAAALPLEATLGDGPDPEVFAYHQLQHGPRIELVDVARRPGMQRWWASGEYRPA